MSNSTSLINLGELSKPATMLVEKVSDAIGGIFKPWQIRRTARADAEAEKIKAVARIEIAELHQRALRRFITEEAKRQNNIETITAKALPLVEENAQPQNMEDDWITNFFDKCRIISDNDMQEIWSKILAGEANEPGTYSKRTINFLGSMDKTDAYLFQSLCSFNLRVTTLEPFIYYKSTEIYKKYGINFDSLSHLAEIGLVSFSSLTGFVLTGLEKKTRITYYGKLIDIEFDKEVDNELRIGNVKLSKIGQELASICGSQPISEFFDFVLDYWVSMRLCISSPLNR